MLKVKSKIKNGFTLVELLVVMALVSILATIALGQFNSAKVKARDVQRKSDVSAVVKSLNFFLSDYKRIYSQVSPSSLNSGCPINDLFRRNCVNGQVSLLSPDGGYTYIPDAPQEEFVADRDGPDVLKDVNNYCYIERPDNNSFAVFANLENKSDGDCRQYYLKSGDVGGTIYSSTATECSDAQLQYYNYGIASPNARLEDFVTNVAAGQTAPPCD